MKWRWEGLVQDRQWDYGKRIRRVKMSVLHRRVEGDEPVSLLVSISLLSSLPFSLLSFLSILACFPRGGQGPGKICFFLAGQ